MLNNWDLDYFDSGEFQVVEERLNDLAKQGIRTCPARKDMFRALKLIKPEAVRVAIFGQDPYPRRYDATGVAFSVPATRPIPPTLSNIFDEYCEDLHYPRPATGNLEPWCERGVLLWNVIPSCTEGQPGSHRWIEWTLLTTQIVSLLDAKESVLFVGLGSLAHSQLSSVQSSPVILTSHPSPLGVAKGRIPFKGSRLFSTINGKLCEMGKEPINWRL